MGRPDPYAGGSMTKELFLILNGVAFLALSALLFKPDENKSRLSVRNGCSMWCGFFGVILLVFGIGPLVQGFYETLPDTYGGPR